MIMVNGYLRQSLKKATKMIVFNWSFCNIKLFFSKLTELITNVFLIKDVNVAQNPHSTFLVEVQF